MKGLLKYLSFRGRANRQRYWMTVLAMVGVLIATMIVNVALALVPILNLVTLPVWLALVVAVFANATRRLHDRNRSGWWLLLFYVLPAVLGIPLQLAEHSPDVGFQAVASFVALLGLPFSIWGLVELGFLKGTAGPNKYGEDPLASSLEPAVA